MKHLTIKYSVLALSVWIFIIFSARFFLEYDMRSLAASDEGIQESVRSIDQTQTGQAGTAQQRAIINLTELSQRQSMFASSKETPKEIIFNYLPDKSATGEKASPLKVIPRQSITRLAESSPLPSASFLALEDNVTRIPPDTHGSVGLNHLMVTLNSQIRVQYKSGAAISTLSLDTFWENVNGGSGAFDPRVLYDPFSDRWMVVSADDAKSTTAGLLIAVSHSSDPTGNWYQYRIQSRDSNWIDYPNIGFNNNWIVITANLFDSSGNFVRKEIYAFDKNNLYSGGSGSYTLFTDTSGGGSWSPAETFDNNLSTMYLMQTYNASSGTLRLAIITGLVGAEIFSTDTLGSYNVYYGAGWSSSAPNGADFAPQLGTANKIQTNDHRIQNLVFRNGHLWTAHTVFLPAGGSPTHSAIQWWQIAPNNPPSTPANVVQKGRIEDINAQIFYAFPSIAVNKDNDALIGFSRFSANQYASGNYAFRSASDPANTFRSDVVLKSGEASYYKTYGGTTNRWGDYSHSTVDPLNDNDFWTIQEYAWTNNGQYDRWSTWWGKILPPGPPGTPTPTATATHTPTPTNTATPTPTATNTPTPTPLILHNPIYFPDILRN
jgi:hypothetical protein